MEDLLVIASCYDPTLPPHIVAYLDELVEFCNKRQPAVIFLTGACTRGFTLPGRSEAMVIYDYLRPRLTPGYDPVIFFDDKAWTTIDNIQNAARKLKVKKSSSPYRHFNVVVFCEARKAVAVDILCRAFLKKIPVIKTGSWLTESAVMQLFMTFYVWLATLPMGGILAWLLRQVRKYQLSRM